MPGSPNILFLISDEHSFRFMGHRARSQGGEDIDTPALDRLAAGATVFDNAYCAVPLCVPSRMCLMTGLEAPHCGAVDNFSVLDPALDTMPKMLNRAGYDTTLVGKMHFGGNLQFHGFRNRPYGDLLGTGIHQYEDDLWSTDGKKSPRNVGLDVERNIGDNLISRTRLVGETGIPESQLSDRIVAEETLAFLRNSAAESRDRPWFLCASFSRPHFPLTAPARFASRYRADNVSGPYVPASGDSYDHPVSRAIRRAWHVDRIDEAECMAARAGYFACVAYLDEVIGDLLMQLESSGLLENTIIVYASDHGEMAGELGTWWKSGWYEGCARVPLMISTPAQRRGEQPAAHVETPVSLVDLAPTFAGLAGGAPAREVDGRDLSATVLGGAPVPEQPVFCDHINARWGEGSEFRAMRWRQWKYVAFRNGDDLLFDLSRDPGEAHNLIDQAPADVLKVFARHRLDFDARLPAVQASQAELRQRYPLDKSGATPSQYLLKDGRVVAAEGTLFRATVHTERADRLFADWPGTRLT